LSGGGGSGNTLYGTASDTTWNITSANYGTLTGGVEFVAMQNLIGGRGNDRFAFAPGAGVTGFIYDLGGSNTLDYSAWTANVTANLASGSPTGAGAGVRGAQNVIGGSGNDVLVGNDDSNRLEGGAGRDPVRWQRGHRRRRRGECQRRQRRRRRHRQF